MMQGMIWMHVIGLIILLSLGYILWVLSDKESGNMKMTGMILSVLIIIIAVVMFLGSLVYGGRMGMGMNGGCMMSSGEMKGGMMMNMSDKEMKEKMGMMMKNPKMREMMKKEMMEYKK
jgi:hypothetical protein